VVRTKRRKKRSKEPVYKRKKLIKTIAILSTIFIIIFVVILLMYPDIFILNNNKGSTFNEKLKAVIIDGLEDDPNPEWIEKVTSYLSSSGYKVDVYKGKNVTINLLLNIGGYKIIILRVHSTIFRSHLFIYSTEKYVESKYVMEQLAGMVERGYVFNKSGPPYFALNAIYLGLRNSKGLKDSIIIMMGCNGTTSPYTIMTLMQKGVKAYISWDGYVTVPHSDLAIVKLIKYICVDNLSLREAVEKVNKNIGPDPHYHSRLILFMRPGNSK